MIELVIDMLACASFFFFGMVIGFEKGRKVGWQELRDGEVYWNEQKGFLAKRKKVLHE